MTRSSSQLYCDQRAGGTPPEREEPVTGLEASLLGSPSLKGWGVVHGTSPSSAGSELRVFADGELAGVGQAERADCRFSVDLHGGIVPGRRERLAPGRKSPPGLQLPAPVGSGCCRLSPLSSGLWLMFWR